ncbi:short-chain fatty acyl-CoA regulator family protein [Corynebacterium sp.]|uniref:short-chain fatty acyl-CoA regulator family protein n=1 Tax=Corynebacterium sp. TaxID=1720 RepID=UPI0026DA9D81|nr:short-chain fatty acyl-CoA regulator family protein [Corynebacterium sp.]MDO5031167.1 short-chain fatty acyl-CoA regulator family protein [Corynebacterium sp.]
MSKHYAGARIHALRKERGLTQSAMAKQLGLSTSYLNQLENDQRPLTVTVLMQLAQRFDVDPTYFAGDRDLRAIAELRRLFPEASDPTLSDLSSRFPELLPRLMEVAAHAPKEQGPFEAVRDFFYDAHNYVHSLDVAAEELAGQLGDRVLRRGRLAARLHEDFGVSTRFSSAYPRRRTFIDRELHLQAGLTEAQLLFEMALQYCLLAYKDHCAELVAELPLGDAQRIGTLGLAQYFAAAVTMPYTQILETAEETRYDIDLIARSFGTGFETTAQRLGTLQRPGNRGVPFSFIRTDRAGNISKRQSATAFHFARSGGSCPLWVVHRAFETPNRITRQVASMPDDHTYLWIARFVQGPAQEWGTPRKEFVVGLGCDIAQADRVVYADALNLTPSEATPIGPGCAACPRRGCPQRAFPQAGRPVKLNLDATPDAAYDTA